MKACGVKEVCGVVAVKTVSVSLKFKANLVGKLCGPFSCANKGHTAEGNSRARATNFGSFVEKAHDKTLFS